MRARRCHPRSTGLLVQGRVNEMVAKLDGLSKERRFSRHVAADDGSFIEFTDVEVKTPTDVVLVKSLNFKLGRGDSLLLTGHNGAGKSSIFRCLGGLWPVLKGSIVKPGGSAAGLNKEVFFLPQKPYNVLGTLPEQLTYPATMKDGETISRAEIKQILAQVRQRQRQRRHRFYYLLSFWEAFLTDRSALYHPASAVRCRLFFKNLVKCPMLIGLPKCRLYDSSMTRPCTPIG